MLSVVSIANIVSYYFRHWPAIHPCVGLWHPLGRDPWDSALAGSARKGQLADKIIIFSSNLWIIWLYLLEIYQLRKRTLLITYNAMCRCDMWEAATWQGGNFSLLRVLPRRMGWPSTRCCNSSELFFFKIVLPRIDEMRLCSRYSLLCREPEWEVLEVAAREGVGILPWSPLKVRKTAWFSLRLPVVSKGLIRVSELTDYI